VLPPVHCADASSARARRCRQRASTASCSGGGGDANTAQESRSRGIKSRPELGASRFTESAVPPTWELPSSWGSRLTRSSGSGGFDEELSPALPKAGGPCARPLVACGDESHRGNRQRRSSAYFRCRNVRGTQGRPWWLDGTPRPGTHEALRIGCDWRVAKGNRQGYRRGRRFAGAERRTLERREPRCWAARARR
jgi:hypothetical protein